MDIYLRNTHSTHCGIVWEQVSKAVTVTSDIKNSLKIHTAYQYFGMLPQSLQAPYHRDGIGYITIVYVWLTANCDFGLVFLHIV